MCSRELEPNDVRDSQKWPLGTKIAVKGEVNSTTRVGAQNPNG
jgi:hypothetical protein